jgi:hypothetical protein
MPKRRLIRLTIAITLLLALAAALRWRFTVPPLAPPPTPGRSNDAPRRPAGPGADTDLRAPAPDTGHAPEGRLAAMTAQDLRQRARYPRSSQPLRDGDKDPILRDYEVSHSAFPGPNGEDPALTAFPDQVNFEHPEPITLYAYLTTAGARVAARSIEAEVIDDASQRLARLSFADDGVDPDRHAGDLVYSARVPAAVGEQLAGGPYIVRVRALSADGQERMAATGFLYSRPDAQLTGRYADATVDGNLEVRAEVEVSRDGRFYLQATLYTQSDAPLAWAQNALSLPPGVHWIPLSFFGLILREHGEDGPYVLRFAALSTTTSMPNAKNRLVENAYVTGPYRAAEFSDRAYDDPHLIDAAQRLERAAAGNPEPGAGGSPEDTHSP